MTTETMTDPKPHVTLDEITALAKRRGFIFQSSEIYGGIGGFFDYGPLGAILKRNVKNAWWREIVELRDDVVAFDSSIVMHPQTWVASGHVASFHDKLVDCRNCKHRFRADHLPSLDKCPDCGMSGTLTEPRNFSLMMKTQVGAMEDADSLAYLRPETAQGMFVNFKNIYQAARKKPPFGIAQIGKSFRNEITPRYFTFRTREFEQAELEYFVPDDGHDLAAYEEWVRARKQWYSDYGVRPERLRFYELTPAERPHYARAGTDVEYLFPWGWGELESIAHRGTYDLDAHMRLSGKDLTYFDEATKSKYTPILIESSAGMDRTTLTMLVDAYATETVTEGEKETKRTVLRFHPKIAPVQAGVFPLARNKPELVERAHAVEKALRPRFRTQYDEGNVGQLYRRQDEIGTPFCIMIDYEGLADTTVTVRDRDSMKQDRVSQDQLATYLTERLG
ncbi:MAG: glycyl-tRNA synthetase [Candidatus Eremiobacteraeota bacterium]|jgi:glycyl-tRNA synthetase|nr:glycyl-tRNA synthetase [Candidatus Eremiobacteraeota bacterium]